MTDQSMVKLGSSTDPYNDAKERGWDITDASEDLAELALSDAILGNADPNAIAEAQDWYDLGLRAYDNGKAKLAVLRFKRSWEAATGSG